MLCRIKLVSIQGLSLYHVLQNLKIGVDAVDVAGLEMTQKRLHSVDAGGGNSVQIGLCLACIIC